MLRRGASGTARAAGGDDIARLGGRPGSDNERQTAASLPPQGLADLPSMVGLAIAARKSTPARNTQARYNVCPTDPIDVVIERDCVSMRWGLVPYWSGIILCVNPDQ